MTSRPETVAMQDPVTVSSSAGPAFLMKQQLSSREKLRKQFEDDGNIGSHLHHWIKAIYDKKRQSRSDHVQPAQGQGESAAVQDSALNVSALGFGASGQRSQQKSRRPVTQIHFQTAEQRTEQLSAGDSTLKVPLPPIISSRDVPEVSDEEQNVGITGKPELFLREAQETAVMKRDELAPSPIPQPQNLVSERRLSRSPVRKSQNKPRPFGIKKAKQMAKTKTQGPVKQNEDGLIHGQSAKLGQDLDDEHGRARRVVTQLDFAAWVDDGPIPRPAENLPPREIDGAFCQYAEVCGCASKERLAGRTQKILIPKIVARSTRATQEASQEGLVTPVTVVFEARGTDDEWIKVHEVYVDPSDPTAAERLARKDAKNRQAIFYEKNLHIISPPQSFYAAIADGTNTVFMVFDGDLPVDETLSSITQERNPENPRQGAKHRHYV